VDHENANPFMHAESADATTRHSSNTSPDINGIPLQPVGAAMLSVSTLVAMSKHGSLSMTGTTRGIDTIETLTAKRTASLAVLFVKQC